MFAFAAPIDTRTGLEVVGALGLGLLMRREVKIGEAAIVNTATLIMRASVKCWVGLNPPTNALNGRNL